MRFRFTLSHDVLGSQVISEPDGWAGAKIKLERDPEFFSLIEYYEGSANGAFIFYGSNNAEGIDGGIDFIREVETTYGFDAEITMLIEYSDDNVTYSTLFSGQLDLSQKVEMYDNKMQVPVIRNDSWSKFINRFDTPVNLSSLTDLDGNAVDPVTPVTINLLPQVLQQSYEGNSSYPGFTDEDINVIVEGTYYGVSFDQVEVDEITEVFIIPQVDSTETPAPVFELRYGGTYSFEIQTLAYDYNPPYNFGVGEDLSDYIRFYININGTETEFTVGDLFQSTNIDGGRVYTLNLTNQILEAGSIIRIYGKAIADLTTGGGAYDGQIRWNGPVSGSLSINNGGATNTTIECYCRVTGNTTYPATQAQGYLIHDLIDGILARIGADPLYSEFLGSTSTNTRQYDSDGCGWMYAIVKGVHIRGYTLTDDEEDPAQRYSLQQKAFFASLRQIWDGINPILNLGLGYDTVEGESVIRVEQKRHFVGSPAPGFGFIGTPPVNFSNVRDITATYDTDYIFKTIRVGYKKWQSEDVSGIDDPQTKHTYATRFIKVGKELTIESDFIAASYAIETTRRTKIEKSRDYKFDNDNFIIALNTDDVSPDVYEPETDENFTSVSNLLNSSSRYNLMLTPMRNLLRWAIYLGGCLQDYASSAYKFVWGEGNYDMTSDAILGSCERAVLDDSLSESDDISLAGLTNTNLGYYFLPMLYEFRIPMEKSDYDLIDRKKPIGISQTEDDHERFFIKELEYEILKGEAVIKAWPRSYFAITVPEQTITTPDCGAGDEAGDGGIDAAYQSILDYATTQGYTLPSAEQQVLQNQLIADLKAIGAWDRLDILYVFATDGNDEYARINWKNPGTFDCTEEVSSLTHTPNEGFTPNGTNYLDTHWAPSTDGVNYTLNSASVFIHINTNVASNTAIDYGVRHTSNALGRVLLQSRNTLNQVGSIALNSGVAGAGSNSDSIGFYLNTRNGSTTADHDLYKNGTLNSASNAGSGALPDQDMVICGFREAAGSVGSFSTREVSCFGAGSAMEDIQSELYQAWNDYFTSL